MSFHNVRFPTNIDIGINGGPGFRTFIIENEGGVETRASRWNSERRRWSLSYRGDLEADIYTIIEFYMARSGALFSFRFKDYRDFTTASDGVSAYAFDDVQIGTGDGSETAFQLVKKYSSGAITRTRNITKPVTGSVAVGINGVNQASGWTVDTTTGIVTFTSAPGSGLTVTAGFEFDNHVRFDQKDDDLLQVRSVDPELFVLPDLQIVEVKDELQLGDEPSYGGAVYKSISADIELAVSEARVYSIITANGTENIDLPDHANLPVGGPYFYISVGGAGGNIRDESNNNLVTGAGSMVIYTAILAYATSPTIKDWLVF